MSLFIQKVEDINLLINLCSVAKRKPWQPENKHVNIIQ